MKKGIWKNNGTDKRGLGTREVAERLGCCQRIARKLLKTELPSYRLGKDLRVDSDALEVWIKRGIGK